VKEWHYVSCKSKIQEIRGSGNYLSFKNSGVDFIELEIVNAMLLELDVKLLKPLTYARPGFLEEVEKSVARIGFKDPFVVHNITDVPECYQHGLFIKSGNNRIRLCEKFNIERVSCVVINISGWCFGGECYNTKFNGKELKTDEDVMNLFLGKKVRVTRRDGKICNIYVPKWLKNRENY
jgi:hypothetical protein